MRKRGKRTWRSLTLHWILRSRRSSSEERKGWRWSKAHNCFTFHRSWFYICFLRLLVGNQTEITRFLGTDELRLLLIQDYERGARGFITFWWEGRNNSPRATSARLMSTLKQGVKGRLRKRGRDLRSDCIWRCWRKKVHFPATDSWLILLLDVSIL